MLHGGCAWDDPVRAAGSLEIELQSLSPVPGGRTAHIDWSSLVIRTSDADFEGAAPWAIHARHALAPYFAENPAPAATPGKRRMLVLGIDGASWDLMADAHNAQTTQSPKTR